MVFDVPISKVASRMTGIKSLLTVLNSYKCLSSSLAVFDFCSVDGMKIGAVDSFTCLLSADFCPVNHMIGDETGMDKAPLYLATCLPLLRAFSTDVRSLNSTRKKFWKRTWLERDRGRGKEILPENRCWLG